MHGIKVWRLKWRNITRIQKNRGASAPSEQTTALSVIKVGILKFSFNSAQPGKKQGVIA